MSFSSKAENVRKNIKFPQYNHSPQTNKGTSSSKKKTCFIARKNGQNFFPFFPIRDKNKFR